MGIFGQIKVPVVAALDELLNDEDFSAEVTYKRYTGQSFNEDEGHSVSTYSSTKITMSRLRHNARSALVATASVQVGDFVFICKADDVPEGMSLKDLIVDGDGNVFPVKDINNIFDMAVVINVESGGVQ